MWPPNQKYASTVKVGTWTPNMYSLQWVKVPLQGDIAVPLRCVHKTEEQQNKCGNSTDLKKKKKKKKVET